MNEEARERKRRRDSARKRTDAYRSDQRRRAAAASALNSRTCDVCGGPLSVRNQSGICAKNYECRVRQQLKRQEGRRTRPPKGDSVWLLPPAYEIDEKGNQLKGDDGQPIEIVDEVAIRVAVSGLRRVALTEEERCRVTEQMIKTGWQYREIADHIGTSPAKLRPVIEALGYVLIPRRQPGSSHPREATEIRKAS